MRAIRIESPGGPEVMKLVELPTPSPGSVGPRNDGMVGNGCETPVLTDANHRHAAK